MECGKNQTKRNKTKTSPLGGLFGFTERNGFIVY